jgi:hypothetical protein
MAPTLSKGFHIGREDIKATERFIVYPGRERYSVSKDVVVLSLTDMMQELRGIK